ncbi:hypothetical protein [Cytobacillus horneckiae]|uniref:Transcriptional regulator n=1 Tax=Cytobacillus horneckiae TaxID=549687 RepID=A0A2N0ZFA1_9BACI|nr:hypothetical protein [Cytobacillus horneckiae]MEC1155633.1 hypothetical protein [Cytobacillus horneckiae]MED2936951.1 hypothetical protein [Cytobacillus horneckiae]PKG28187.1 hypothetical protein CWS20_15195 [Cytobacillus horneckiae]
MLNRDQIDDIRFCAMKKKIKNKDIAQAIVSSDALVSLFLNHKTNMSSEKQEKLIEFVENQPEYKLVRV